MYKGEGVSFEPEGLVSTLPAIVQVIFGYFVGNYIQQKGKSYEMLSIFLLRELYSSLPDFVGIFHSQSIKKYGQVLLLYIQRD